MGNINNVPIDNQEESDQEFLNCQISAIFNDSFVASVHDRLPSYEPKEKQEKKAQDNADVAPSTEAIRLKKLMAIFSHSKKSSCKVEDFEVSLESLLHLSLMDFDPHICFTQGLSVTKDVESSGFAMSNVKRSKLLMRIFHVRPMSTFTNKFRQE